MASGSDAVLRTDYARRNDGKSLLSFFLFLDQTCQEEMTSDDIQDNSTGIMPDVHGRIAQPDTRCSTDISGDSSAQARNKRNEIEAAHQGCNIAYTDLWDCTAE